MIQSFAHKGLRSFFERGSKAGIPPAHARRLRLILGLLHEASAPRDVAFPGSGLHPLRGDLEGYWAVSVNGPWRVTFRFEDGDIREVNLVQYH
jgi:proteic killer suppression protein